MSPCDHPATEEFFRAQERSWKTDLRQPYHSNFGSLLQNVNGRAEKSPRDLGVTLVTISETETKIRLS